MNTGAVLLSGNIFFLTWVTAPRRWINFHFEIYHQEQMSFYGGLGIFDDADSVGCSV